MPSRRSGTSGRPPSARHVSGGAHGHDDRCPRPPAFLAKAWIDAGLWISLLKTVTSRTRPSGGTQGSGRFFSYNPPKGEDNRSFPSGHAMGSFALATVFAHQYPEKRWVSWVFYGAAGLIGVSRITLGRHYPSDVLVGAILGNSIGRMVVARGSEGRPAGNAASFAALMGWEAPDAGRWPARGRRGSSARTAMALEPRAPPPPSTVQPYYDTDHQRASPTRASAQRRGCRRGGAGSGPARSSGRGVRV
jgi:hypothetical protein